MDWPITDIGLHVVNDQYNGMLVTYTYHEGRYYHVPHLQFSTVKELTKRIYRKWLAVRCDCSQNVVCCGVGCYECFQSECAQCEGTGWKNFGGWKKNGFQIDYDSGVPVAVGLHPAIPTGLR